VVQVNDTLWDLSLRYQVTMASIREANGMARNASVIIPGRRLRLPAHAKADATARAPKAAALQPPAVDVPVAPAPGPFRIELPQLLRKQPEAVPAPRAAPPVVKSQFEAAAPASAERPQETARPRGGRGDLWASSDTFVVRTDIGTLDVLLEVQGNGQCERDTLLVVYDSACVHCRNIEALVRRPPAAPHAMRHELASVQ